MNDLYQYVTTTKVVTEIVSSTQSIDLAGWFTQLTHFSNLMSEWMYSHIGITLISIVKFIADFFVWILQFMVETIKQGMALLK